MEICNAVHLVVQISRLADGSRRVTEISEVHPQLNESGEYRTTDIYQLRLRGKNDADKLIGDLEPTGAIPTFFNKAISQGLRMDRSDFSPEDDTEAFKRP